MLFFCPSCGLQAFALPHPLRISNAVSPRQHVLYINMLYRCVPRRRFGCHLPVVGLEFAKFVSHQDRRSKTSFLYIRPPALPLRTNKRCGKDNVFFKSSQTLAKFFLLFVKKKKGNAMKIQLSQEHNFHFNSRNLRKQIK